MARLIFGFVLNNLQITSQKNRKVGKKVFNGAFITRRLFMISAFLWMLWNHWDGNIGYCRIPNHFTVNTTISWGKRRKKHCMHQMESVSLIYCWYLGVYSSFSCIYVFLDLFIIYYWLYFIAADTSINFVILLNSDRSRETYWTYVEWHLSNFLPKIQELAGRA